ncbi:hypothetical protein L873DRAFT_473102 [Choiromyces venosus 120613-1]|uniref:Defective in cullin neddylation protein n=1 Tax=Choiromyces venosus 120613-1 TaxID=1336337 RepID=A0A3N4IZN3_9PEZI|nr:hypothetical protein L873DRAFT_473102 [Choiromyces venosus 120613-1]
MSPKKSSAVQPSSSRVTRSSARKTTAQSSTPAPLPQPSSASMSAPTGRNATGPRKRKREVVNLISDDDSGPESERDGTTMGNSQSRHKERRRQETPPGKPARKSSRKNKAKIVTARAASPDTILTCWFDELKGSNDEITMMESIPWLQTLGVSPDGIAFWVIAYWCEAKGEGSIKLKEFIEGMKALDIYSNDTLRRELPNLMQLVAPGSERFQKFYWFCYEFFKAPDAKYLPLDMACEIFNIILDETTYNTKWAPPGESKNPLKVKQPISWERFPHRHAFLEFLKSTPQPTRVITKDQYRQFLPFNEQVDLEFEEYTIETSVWPSLFDQFVAWRKEKLPKDENSMDQT